MPILESDWIGKERVCLVVTPVTAAGVCIYLVRSSFGGLRQAGLSLRKQLLELSRYCAPAGGASDIPVSRLSRDSAAHAV